MCKQVLTLSPHYLYLPYFSYLIPLARNFTVRVGISTFSLK